MATFNFAEYFGSILPLANATRRTETRFWEPGAVEKPVASEYVLYLGCNVLRTVNLAETMLAVLEAMGVDVLPVGGPAYCCGIVHQRQGEQATSDRMIGKSMGTFNRLAPKELLVYCPSCHSQMDEKIPESLGLDIPYRHVTDFLAERVASISFKQPLPMKVALHHHPHNAQQVKDAKAVRTLLEAIPDLEVVELPVGEDWGRHCVSSQLQPSNVSPLEERAGAMVADAVAQGCATVATVYHSCYRELCVYEQDDGPEVVNYIELVARGMGLELPDATFKRLKQASDPETALQELAPIAERRNAGGKRFESSVAYHFTPPSR